MNDFSPPSLSKKKSLPSQLRARLFPRARPALGFFDHRLHRCVPHELLGEHHGGRNVVVPEPVALDVAHVEILLLRRRVRLERAAFALRVFFLFGRGHTGSRLEVSDGAIDRVARVWKTRKRSARYRSARRDVRRVAEKRRFFRRFKKKEKPIFRSSDAFGYGNGWRFLSARSFRLYERGVANRLSHPQRVVVTAERARKRLFLRDRKVLRKQKRETSANATGRGLRRAISVPIRTISPS